MKAKKTAKKTVDQKIHQSALALSREQIKKHAMGRLDFLAFVGTRPWGISTENADYDYRGIYSSKEENTYHAFLSQAYLNNYIKDIILISLERFITDLLRMDVHSLIILNSPVIYASAEFLEFKRWINSHLAKKNFLTYLEKSFRVSRKDYLYDFFFIGNAIAILEKKKIIPNLSELNRKDLKIKNMEEIIKNASQAAEFEPKEKALCENILQQLKNRLIKADKNSSLLAEMKMNGFVKLKIAKRINWQYWHPDSSIGRYTIERKKLGV
jgi:predicted nucleotidyltransferase